MRRGAVGCKPLLIFTPEVDPAPHTKPTQT
jgi:hypothetical protein